MIAAMMSAFGGHWMALQSVAWAGMVLANIQHGNLSHALEQTFDGKHPCPLCKTIEKGRKSEKQQEAQAAIGKINFIHQTSAVVLISPRVYSELRAHDAFGRGRGHRPLLQPPRETPA